jgi:hypothetical protein
MNIKISTVREHPLEVIDVIQQTIKNYSKPTRIVLDNDSAILCELVILCYGGVVGSGLRLDLTDNNFSPPKIIPSKMLGPMYERPYNKEEIKKAVNYLIQIINTMSFPSISKTYQECCVCLEMTNKITKCNHVVCEGCSKKIEEMCYDNIGEMEDDDWNDDSLMPQCPMCRKMF